MIKNIEKKVVETFFHDKRNVLYMVFLNSLRISSVTYYFFVQNKTKYKIYYFKMTIANRAATIFFLP